MIIFLVLTENVFVLIMYFTLLPWKLIQSYAYSEQKEKFDTFYGIFSDQSIVQLNSFF